MRHPVSGIVRMDGSFVSGIVRMDGSFAGEGEPHPRSSAGAVTSPLAASPASGPMSPASSYGSPASATLSPMVGDGHAGGAVFSSSEEESLRCVGREMLWS